MDASVQDRLTGLFTKRPEPGRVKTRLEPRLGPGGAARLAEAMLRDAAERCQGTRLFRTALVFAPPGDGPWFRKELAGLPDQRPQRGPDLGSRLAAFFADAFAAGEARSVVAIGSDQPLVSSARIAAAHAALEAGAGCVLGPDAGGGYYLVGLARSLPELFTAVPMSSAGTCAATARLARERGLALELLPVELDVDTPDDLERLRRALAAEYARGPGPEFPRRTHAVLRQFLPAHP
jgi:hypothetical protein